MHYLIKILVISDHFTYPYSLWWTLVVESSKTIEACTIQCFIFRYRRSHDVSKSFFLLFIVCFSVILWSFSCYLWGLFSCYLWVFFLLFVRFFSCYLWRLFFCHFWSFCCYLWSLCYSFMLFIPVQCYL